MAKQKAPANDPVPDQLASKTLILDNGAHTLKAGFSTPSTSTTTDCHAIPNCIARSHRDKRTYIGPELSHECADFGELAFRRPVEKGYIVNWESEKAIWERSFVDRDAYGALGLSCEPEDTNLILTEAPNAPAQLQKNADEMVFEEFGFAGYARVLGLLVYTYTLSPSTSH